MKKMTQKQDDVADKKAGRKEGSKADIAQDRRNGIKDKKVTKKKSIIDMYRGATKNLQSVGRNMTRGANNYVKKVRNNMAAADKAFAERKNNSNYYGTVNPFPNPLKKESYRKRK